MSADLQERRRPERRRGRPARPRSDAAARTADTARFADRFGDQRTDRGRRPFRPGPEWRSRLGELAYGVYLLADQSSVDVAQAVTAAAADLAAQRRRARAAGTEGWPFDAIDRTETPCASAF